MAKQWEKLWQRTRALPPGLWIVVMVMALVGGRYLWICADRPAHRQEIAAAFGSVALFYGAPQPDHPGNRVTYVETSDHGYGLFLADASTGHKTIVHEENALGSFGDHYDLHAWPWSPDDSSFIYSAAGQIVVCDPETGKDLAEMNVSTDVTALIWLTPTVFVCLDANNILYQFEKQTDGTWIRKDPSDHQAGKFALRSVGGIGTASANDAAERAEKAFDRNETTRWSSGNAAAPVWLQYQFNNPAWVITQYKLISSPDDASADPRDWQLLGSNDGSNWNVLDARTNEMFTSRTQTKEYDFSNETPYRFYRLNIMATAGKAGSVRLAEFQLWSKNEVDIASGTKKKISPAENAAKAFDGLTGTKWFDDHETSSGWLQYEFGGGAACWRYPQYTLTSANDAHNRDPKDWQLLASNDGDNWTTLDARANEIFKSRLQSKSYSFPNTIPYRFYRLNITTNAGGGTNGLQLAELNLLSKNAFGELSSITIPKNPFSGVFSLTTLSSDTIAWGQGNRLWSMSLTSGIPSLLLNLHAAAPTNITLNSFSYSKDTGQFLLSCAQGGKDSLYRFDSQDPVSGLQPVTITARVHDAVWINGTDNGGWVGLENSHLLARKNATAIPIDLTSIASIANFTISPDGQRIFLRGTVSNELSAGIWQYDLASSKVRCVVPSTDFVSPYVGHIQPEPVKDPAITASGKYTVYLPVDFNPHSHRKYPLIIGATDFGVVKDGAHGRLWVPAMAACDAYVVIVNRGGWWNGLEQWGDDITTAYQQLSPYLRIDKNRVFLFGASAETEYMSEFMAKSPGLWAGAILLNPTGLPDFSKSPPFQQRPRILISAGGEEYEDARLKQFQADALKSGVLVDVIIHPGEGHHLVGNAAQLERTKAMMHFIFEE